jgi:SAM-dependent methyltransferase
MNTSATWDIYWREQTRRRATWLPKALAQGGWAHTNALFHLEVLRKESGARRVLDAACGVGAGMVALAKLGFEVTGSDVSPSAIAFAREWFNELGLEARVEVADWSNLPRAFPGMHFDAILCDALVWCETTAEITAAARSFAEVLRPGGIVIFHGTFPEATRETLASFLEEAAARPPLEECCGGLSHTCVYEVDRDALVELHSFTDADGRVTMCQLRQLYRHTWPDITQAFDDAGGWELEPRLVKVKKEKRRFVVARRA